MAKSASNSGAPCGEQSANPSEQSAEKWNIWWFGSGRGLAQLREAAASNHTGYLNLPEEKDAHATGDAVEDLLRQKMVTSAVNWAAKSIGRLADF